MGRTEVLSTFVKICVCHKDHHHQLSETPRDRRIQRSIEKNLCAYDDANGVTIVQICAFVFFFNVCRARASSLTKLSKQYVANRKEISYVMNAYKLSK